VHPLIITQQPSKKSKPSTKPDSDAPIKGSNGRPQRRPDQPKKIKLRDQKIIPVPKTVFAGDDNGMDLDLGDEEDEELDIAGAGFLTGLDKNALSR
jgi:nucleolar complex protein 3